MKKALILVMSVVFLISGISLVSCKKKEITQEKESVTEPAVIGEKAPTAGYGKKKPTAGYGEKKPTAGYGEKKPAEAGGNQK